MPSQYYFTDSNPNITYKVFVSLKHCGLFSPFHVKKGTKGKKNAEASGLQNTH